MTLLGRRTWTLGVRRRPDLGPGEVGFMLVGRGYLQLREVVVVVVVVSILVLDVSGSVLGGTG